MSLVSTNAFEVGTTRPDACRVRVSTASDFRSSQARVTAGTSSWRYRAASSIPIQSVDPGRRTNARPLPRPPLSLQDALSYEWKPLELGGYLDLFVLVGHIELDCAAWGTETGVAR